VLPDPARLPMQADAFAEALRLSLEAWSAGGYRLVLLELPIGLCALIPIAVAEGFRYHHAHPERLTLVRPLTGAKAEVPVPTHFVGAGAVVLNDQREVLTVWERADRAAGPRYKLPGGFIEAGEHIQDGVVREVLEETGVRTAFERVVAVRNWHGARFGLSDLYFVCRLAPLSEALTPQEDEIREARWMALEEFLRHPGVHAFNREMVHVALADGGLEAAWLDGYEADPALREILRLPGPT
jgi:ADP-ribose pyrophosphatase YjhB (NUDIX family)